MGNFGRPTLEQSVHQIFIVNKSIQSILQSCKHTTKPQSSVNKQTERTKCYRTRALVHILVSRWSVSAGGGSDKGRRRLRDSPLRTETLSTLTRSDSISRPAQKQKGSPDRHTMARMCWLQGRHVTLNAQRRIPAVVSICNGAYLSQAVSS